MSTMPAAAAVAVTASDVTNISSGPARALFVGTGGNVALVVSPTGSAVLFKNVPSGSVLPVSALRVNATNTTAADIVALY